MRGVRDVGKYKLEVRTASRAKRTDNKTETERKGL